jgi:tetratricopeptide (TPR) repeat protein
LLLEKGFWGVLYFVGILKKEKHLSKNKRRKPPVSAPPAQKTLAQYQTIPVKHLLAIALMVMITLVAYSNTFHVPFQFDDEPNIRENSRIQIRTLTFASIEELVKNTYKESLRVFTFFTFALNYYFGRFNVFGYHLVNFLIHIASGILLFYLLYLTLNLPSLKDRYAHLAFSTAFFSSLIFLSHPIQTQSVTFIVQRLTSLAAMFYLLSMLLYVKGRLSKEKDSIFYFAGSAISYLLGIFSKENTAILPLFIALYEFYFFQKLELNTKTKKTFYYVIGTVLAVAILGLLIWGKRYVDYIIVEYQKWDFTLTERVLTQFRVVLFYLTLLIYPHPSRLNLDHDFSLSKGIFDPSTTLISILIVIGIIGYSVWVARKRPLISFFILWYFGNLVIESSIFPLEMAYEHRLYLPMIGPTVLFVILVEKVWEKIKKVKGKRENGKGEEEETEKIRQQTADFRHQIENKGQVTDRNWQLGIGYWRGDWPLWGFFILISLLFCIGAYSRNIVWKDPITLWEDIIKKSPMKPRGHYNLGLYLVKIKKFDRGIEELNIGLKLDPRDREAYYNLGAAYQEMNAFDRAAFYFSEYIRLAPKDPDGYNKMGIVKLLEKKTDEAIEYFKKGLGIEPNSAKLRGNLGDAYLQKNRLDEAISELKRAVELDSNIVPYHLKLAEAYEKKGRPDLARRVLEKVLEKDPDSYQILVYKGTRYIQDGKFDEALSELNRALILNTTDPNVYQNMGLAYQKKGMVDEAISHYKKALELDDSLSELRVNLGEAYFKKGMVNEAISELQSALHLNPNQPEVHNNLGVIFLQLKRLDEAIPSFKKAIAINNQYGDAYFNLAVAYYYKKDFVSATSYAKKAQEFGVEVDPRLLRGLGMQK